MYEHTMLARARERRRKGEGIGEILPRSDVLGLEDEATVSEFHAVYFARSLRRKPLQHIAEWVEIS